MEKPLPPEDYECCDSGCDPCVWDTYYEELRQWQQEQQASKEVAASEQPAEQEPDA